MSINYGERTISALPARIRVDNQASPLAYSLDYRREVLPGDSWTGISIAPFGEEQGFYDNLSGIQNVEFATMIARGTRSGDDADVKYPGSLKEYAARQIAIWSVVNDLPIDFETVPNRSLRQRASALVAMTRKDGDFPVLLAEHGVQIFLREVSGNTVTFVVQLQLEANRFLVDSQELDISLDGQNLRVRTGEETRVKFDNQRYEVIAAEPIRDQNSIEPNDQTQFNYASIVIDRNSSVLDVSAVWANVTSEAGLGFASEGSSPSLMTADQTILTFSGATRLDPEDYGGPADLLNRAGTQALSDLPTWLLWVALLVGLYVVTRIGRLVDLLVRRLVSSRGRSSPILPTVSTVRAQGRTVKDAAAAGLQVFPEGANVGMTVVDPGGVDASGTDWPAVVDLEERPR